jgi:Na+/H+ antiporter NhaA
LGVEFLLRAQSIFDRAVIDDLGAILVIAIFYETIAFINLFIAFAIMGLIHSQQTKCTPFSVFNWRLPCGISC